MRRTCRFACDCVPDTGGGDFVIFARDPRARPLWENGQVGQSGVR